MSKAPAVASETRIGGRPARPQQKNFAESAERWTRRRHSVAG
jgi:hypothetical protein